MASVLKTIEKWEELLLKKAELFNGAPDDYIPGTFIDLYAAGPTQIRNRYKTMKEPKNTPFQYVFLSNFLSLPYETHDIYLIRYVHLKLYI